MEKTTNDAKTMQCCATRGHLIPDAADRITCAEPRLTDCKAVGLGLRRPAAQAWISASLSPQKPGLSRGFQAEPGPHTTRSGKWRNGKLGCCMLETARLILMLESVSIAASTSKAEQFADRA